MKINTKKFRADVVVKSHKDAINLSMPDFGLGKGVLSTCEVTVKGKIMTKDKVLLASTMIETEKELINDAVEVKWTEIKRKKCTKKN